MISQAEILIYQGHTSDQSVLSIRNDCLSNQGRAIN